MGGMFSGRWGWHRKKARADSCRSFTVAGLLGDHPPAAGRTGRLIWKDAAGGTAAEVAFVFPTDRAVAC